MCRVFYYLAGVDKPVNRRGVVSCVINCKMQCFNKISCTYLIKLLIKKIESALCHELFEMIEHELIFDCQTKFSVFFSIKKNQIYIIILHAEESVMLLYKMVRLNNNLNRLK